MRIQIRPRAEGNRTFSAKSILLAGAALALIASSDPSAAKGTWGVTILHNFTGYPKDGEHPELYGGSLAGGYSSLLYGTTAWGGKSANCNGGGYGGCGTIFTVDTNQDVHHHYPENILYAFSGGDGQAPNGTLWFDVANHNNIWGTTTTGGKLGWGTVFELVPDKHGKYSEKYLYSFGGPGDGATPFGGVVQDSKGNVYGTTGSGGTEGSAGAIFEIDAAGNEYVLHSMNGTTDGYGLYSGLVIDSKGNLFGVAYDGGNMKDCGGFGCGTIFEVAKGGAFKVLYRFKGPESGGADGAWPQGGLTIDRNDNIYGTTTRGGLFGGGTIFEVTKAGVYQGDIHDFSSGDQPSSTMWMDAAGNLYGSTPGGGYNELGYAFELDRKGNFSDIFDWHGTDFDIANTYSGPIVLNGLYYIAGPGGNGQSSCDSPSQSCGAVVRLTSR